MVLRDLSHMKKIFFILWCISKICLHYPVAFFSYCFQNYFLPQTFYTLTTVCPGVDFFWLFIWASLVGFLNQHVHLLSQIWEVFRHLFCWISFLPLSFSTGISIVHILICFMTYQSPLSLLQIFSFLCFFSD